ncbi:ATP-NAD kinase family protein [Sphingoaurantiacus capsulatus]|uniref:ATP-NAD kinase family protein n=1 Tax=Sphingoaurantiacus capsulatus TaxID=1771310 RepID=UPI0036D28C52
MRLGLIVNPIAGIGGRLALKGSDGDLAARALAADAVPLAATRAAQALAAIGAPVELLTAGGAMGEALGGTVVYRPCETSSADDTQAAARAMLEAGIDLLLFAGGDGTARDVMAAVGESVPVLGIPAGVKMHSAVFATSPRAAGALIADLTRRGRIDTVAADVLDRPAPDAPPILYGVLRTPADALRLQPAKASPPADDAAAIEAACRQVARELAEPGVVGVIGPGSTMRRLKALLGFDGSLLGVDIVDGGSLVAADADERTILSAIAGRDARLALGVVGGQGFLLGRGNQQISPAVVRNIGRANIRVVAGMEKLVALPGNRLLVDSGEPELDALLAGYLPVRTNGGRLAMTKVAAA